MTEINQRIRMIRKQKRLTLQQLADLTEFTKGYLSRIENSTVSPRLPTLQAIARALEVDISVFFEESRERKKHKRSIDSVKANSDHQTSTIESDAAYSYQPLVHTFAGKYMAPYLLRIERGHTECFTHDSEEMIFVISGRVRLSYDGEKYLLEPGDSAYFDSRREHQLFNDQQEVAVLLNVVFEYRRF